MDRFSAPDQSRLATIGKNGPTCSYEAGWKGLLDEGPTDARLLGCENPQAGSASRCSAASQFPRERKEQRLKQASLASDVSGMSRNPTPCGGTIPYVARSRELGCLTSEATALPD